MRCGIDVRLSAAPQSTPVASRLLGEQIRTSLGLRVRLKNGVVRAINAMDCNAPLTVASALLLSAKDLTSQKNIGETSAYQWTEWLAENNLLASAHPSWSELAARWNELGGDLRPAQLCLPAPTKPRV
jgi:hypothetical protein